MYRRHAKRLHRGARAAAAISAVTVAAMALTAFGGSSGSAVAVSRAHAAGASSGVAAAKARLAQLYRGIGFSQPDPSGPKPTPGKKVWIISFQQDIPSSATATAGAVAAAKAMGWKPTVLDGKGSADTILGGIRQAIAAKANVIALVFIDCPTVQAGLQEAHNAGITLVADESFDCSGVKKGGPTLFNYVTTYYDNLSYSNYYYNYGEEQATWNIVATGGKAQTVVFDETDSYESIPLIAGYKKELSTCSGCKVAATVDITGADYGPPLQSKAQEAFLKNPSANTVQVIGDGVITLGVGAAVEDSGRAGSFKIIGGEGSPAGLQLIRNNRGMNAAAGISFTWESYAMLEGANRVLHHINPYGKSTGIGLQVVDSGHNLPASGGFRPPINYVAAYQKMWGTGK